MVKVREIKFTCQAVKWFDKLNGNTYHSVRITRNKDGAVVVGAFAYGYGDQYRYTALEKMAGAGWLPSKYSYKNNTLYLFERENNYPINWIVSQGLKRECIANGVIN